MTARNIGGTVDYAQLAALHRPRDPLKLRAEILRLATDQKLTANDISGLLKIDLVLVREILVKAP